MMSEDDKCEGLLRKAIGVVDFPQDYDPNKIPQTGEEYLHYVMYEAKQCKEWVKADIDEEKLHKEKTAVVYELSGCSAAPEEMLPSTEWQEKQVADFSAFRLHIQKLKHKYRPMNDPPPFNGELAQWKKKIALEPQLSDIIVLNHKSMCKVLEYILAMLHEIPEGHSIPYSMGVWLYSILSCLETPLMPDTCSQLREIARKCSEIRSVLAKPYNEELYKPLNIFICIIARYYNNCDLIDQINEM